MEGGYSSENYTYMGPYPLLINIIQTFRNSIGDIDVPLYGSWIPAE